MTRAGPECFGRPLAKDHGIVVSSRQRRVAVVRVLGSYVARVIAGNPLQGRLSRTPATMGAVKVMEIAGGTGAAMIRWP